MKLINVLFLLGLSLSTPVPADIELKSNNILDGTPSPTTIKPIIPKYKYRIDTGSNSVTSSSSTSTSTSTSASASASANPKIMFSNNQEILNHEKNKRKGEYQW